VLVGKIVDGAARKTPWKPGDKIPPDTTYVQVPRSMGVSDLMRFSIESHLAGWSYRTRPPEHLPAMDVDVYHMDRVDGGF
jgi:hypothetical protein